MNEPNFWDNQDKANKICQEVSNLKKITSKFNELKESLEDLEVLKDLGENINDELKKITNDVDEYSKIIYLSGKYDNLNCYLEIHPGAGGTEAQDWAEMLYEMYKKYAEIKQYKFEEVYFQKGDEAGIKSAMAHISGDFAYGYLKNEQGVHRLVRISPFDAGRRRHTSFASVTVTPEFDEDIDITINEEDLKIDVYHSGGAGGQSVNTSNSAVRITHLPTKIVVTCQNERSQLKNKEIAMKLLKNKLYQLNIEKNKNMINDLKDNSEINFGSQIRSYVLEPYKLVKDHRTNYESTSPEKVFNGDLDGFIESNLINNGLQ